MNTKRMILLATIILVTATASVAAQGTAFTYQGRLNDGTNPANGLYEVQFSLHDSVTNGNAVGIPVSLAPVAVSNGLFTVQLDFGVSVFNGAGRWLEITLNLYGSDMVPTTLRPRQPITATPYAIRAANFSGPIADTQLSGNIARLDGNQTFSGTVQFANPANTFAGTFTGNGAGVTNVDLANINSWPAITIGSNLTFIPSPTPPPVGSNAHFVIAFDVDGDSHIDLITVTPTPEFPFIPTVSVLTNDGSGKFALASSQALWRRADAVTAADINRDGRIDLISTSHEAGGDSPGSLSVHTNAGSGIFALASSQAVRRWPVSVVAVDVDEDGSADVITAHGYENTLSVLTNNGSGQLMLASSPVVGRSPSSVTAADVNADGHIDLISANLYGAGPVETSTPGTLSVLTNNGRGSFALASSPVVGDFPSSVTAANVNGDTHIDLIGHSSTGPFVLTNSGGGFFALAAPPPSWLTAGDINGDGYTDLVVARVEAAGSGTLSVLLNEGAKGFTVAATLHVGSIGYYARATIADINADGRIDIIFSSLACVSPGCSQVQGILSVFLNRPLTHFMGHFIGDGAGLANVNLATINSSGAITISSNMFTLGSSPKAGYYSYAVTAADVNRDGHTDLITANALGDSLSVLTNNTSGTFIVASSPPVGRGPRAVAAADLNADGYIDLISANRNENTLSVLTNHGRGMFTLASSPPVGREPMSVAAVDVNGMGGPDLITANYNDDTLTVLFNNGAGGFTFARTLAVGDGPYSVATADVNGDGHVDLISANLATNTLSILINDGHGQFTLASSPAVGTVGNRPISVATADVNRDGRIDLVSANRAGYYPNYDTLSVLINDGNGEFTLAVSLFVDGWLSAVTTTDVNGDSHIDLVTAHSGYDMLSILTNNGSGGFTLAATLRVGDGPSSLAAADVNTDGRIDLISANAYDSTLSILLNRPFNFLGNFSGSANLSGNFSGNANLSGDFSGDFSGTFSGNGSGLTGVNAGNLTGTVPGAALDNAWKIGGNRGTTPGAHFLGTIDNQPLEMKVNGQRVLRLEDVTGPVREYCVDYFSTNAPNLIGGSHSNSVDVGILGASIGGGGIALVQTTWTYDPEYDECWPQEVYHPAHPNRVTADFGTVSGGLDNTSSGYAATVSGGRGNTSSNRYAAVPGGNLNTAGGAYSFAAGRRAQALHDGSFVWADSSDINFGSTSSNQFSVRAVGGVRFVTAVDDTGAATSGVRLRPGGGSWSSLSDRNAKENFAPANAREILEKVAALPVATWNYKAQDKSIRHIGATAQDFRAAFDVGENDRTITTVDADGVALAAIQGLNQKLEEQKGELKQKDAEIEELKRRLGKLEEILTTNKR